MKHCFVDTNLFVRYLTADDPAKADRVERLLNKAAAGAVKLITADLVLVELIWVLESAYDLHPEQIAPMIKAILSTPGLEVINGDIVDKALNNYELKKIDFVDSYIAALMVKHNISEIYSFNRKHLSRLSGLKRIEP
jgi:predicted nucleic-acid-binding protein